MGESPCHLLLSRRTRPPPRGSSSEGACMRVLRSYWRGALPSTQRYVAPCVCHGRGGTQSITLFFTNWFTVVVVNLVVRLGVVHAVFACHPLRTSARTRPLVAADRVDSRPRYWCCVTSRSLLGSPGVTSATSRASSESSSAFFTSAKLETTSASSLRLSWPTLPPTNTWSCLLPSGASGPPSRMMRSILVSFAVTPHEFRKMAQARTLAATLSSPSGAYSNESRLSALSVAKLRPYADASMLSFRSML
mmetsp:Transcript_11624/g.48884  ORF Transcript_11624/g.48884 Transcript_11624/m.48884 type:complete len:249 (-) Transcript_11624:1278-2024(-)